MKSSLSLLALALTGFLAGCAGGTDINQETDASAASDQTTRVDAANPFFTESPLPLHFPRFDTITDADYAPALDRGMADQLQEVDAITNNSDAPTFDNTLVALEKSGQILDRAVTVFFNLSGVENNDAKRAIQNEYAPKLAAHRDAIMLNPQLFARLQRLHAQRKDLGLNAQSVRLIERYHDDFVRAGARLSDPDRTRMRAINGELAKLGADFSQRVLAEVNDSAVVVDDKDELSGLTGAQIEAAANAAKARGLDGKYLIALVNTTLQPVIAQLDNRALRQRIHAASIARGSRGNPYDTTAIVSRVMQLRAEKANMLGYPNWAAYGVANQTAKTPEAVNAMLGKLAPRAVTNARREAAALQAMIDKSQAAKGEPSFQLAAWDWSYYTEKVRADRYAFDESQLKP